jgi:uridine kinase
MVMNELKIVLISGGSCSGKSTIAHSFKNSLVIELDNFYKPTEDVPKNSEGNPDFDQPSSLNIEECCHVVKDLQEKGEARLPIYNIKESRRTGYEKIKIMPSTKFIVIEGLFTFYSPLLELGDMKIFMDTPAEIRVSRRMNRDIERKGFTHTQILKAFIVVEENYHKYIEPTKEKADLVIPFSANPIKML